MEIIEKLRTRYQFFKQYQLWQQLKDPGHRITPNNTGRTYVIVPCDPESVGGSRGDEAMIIATIQQFRLRHPTSKIYIVTSNVRGETYVKGLPFENIISLNTWNGAYPLERIYNSIISLNPNSVVILGADCMDGFYSTQISITLLALHDLLSNTIGLQSILLGFSYNDHPSNLMNRVFKSCSDSTVLRLRDPLSQKRFDHYTHRTSTLVADQAFMLCPAYDFDGYRKLAEWVEKRRNNDSIILGFNFHPMLRKYTRASDIQKDTLNIASNLSKVLKDNTRICFVFIPHDDRNNLSDNVVLPTIYEYICNQGYADRVYYDHMVYRANELKGLCSLLDGLISSRMHLAIAALGQKKPVMVASYQGKFNGLFQHFNLDTNLILPPTEFISSTLCNRISTFASNLDNYQKTIVTYLPEVTTLSQKNLENID